MVPRLWTAAVIANHILLGIRHQEWAYFTEFIHRGYLVLGGSLALSSIVD